MLLNRSVAVAVFGAEALPVANNPPIQEEADELTWHAPLSVLFLVSSKVDRRLVQPRALVEEISRHVLRFFQTNTTAGVHEVLEDRFR